MTTCRVGRGTLSSSTTNVVAYFVLHEEADGKPPTYEFIRSGYTSYEFEYNENQRKLLLEKLAEMRVAIGKGEAHRNHNRPGKCVHCSRRSVCPERLA